MEYENKIITIKHTKFIFKTNFEGKPDEKYGNSARIANIVIPADMVKPLEDAGINVKSWPREPEEGQQITYYIKTQANWRYKNGDLKSEDKWPRIKTFEGKGSVPIEHDEESVGMIDKRLSNIEEISVVLNPWQNQNGGITLYIQDLHVLFSDKSDPFGNLYGRENDEEMPF